jgi:broad specificity phosphatase PhoE
VGLHEHEREHVPFSSTEAFERAVAALFARPGELVMGEESADQARERFERAVRAALDRHAGRDIAIVAHGTVITLLVAHYAGVEPLSFWRRLGMPALVVLALPGYELLEVVERLEDGDELSA